MGYKSNYTHHGHQPHDKLKNKMYAIQQNLYEEECDSESVIDQLVDFTFNGQVTHVEERRGIPFLWNEFWTARQRQSHK